LEKFSRIPMISLSFTDKSSFCLSLYSYGLLVQ